jgi:hypothetical protein
VGHIYEPLSTTGCSSAYLAVLLNHTVGRERADEEERDEGAENGEAGRDPERAGDAERRAALAERRLDVRERVRADERSHLADGGCKAVELAADRCRRCLRREQAEVVARAELAEGEEDAVDDRKRADVVHEVGIRAAHDETKDSLAQESEDHGVLRSKVVNDKRATHGTRDVEEVDDDIPAEDHREHGRFVRDTEYGMRDGLVKQPTGNSRVNNRRGVDAERVGDPVVDEPGDTDRTELDPVTLNDEPVRHIALDRVLLVAGRLLHAQTPKEHGHSGDEAETEGKPPDCPEVVRAANPVEKEGNKRGDDEAPVDHGV